MQETGRQTARSIKRSWAILESGPEPGRGAQEAGHGSPAPPAEKDLPASPGDSPALRAQGQLICLDVRTQNARCDAVRQRNLAAQQRTSEAFTRALAAEEYALYVAERVQEAREVVAADGVAVLAACSAGRY
jgi:hypothetical protein